MRNRSGPRPSRCLLLAVLLCAFASAVVSAAQPPALACIGNEETCTGPVWPTIQYDCITGDHYNKSTSSCSWLPSNRCDQPDIVQDDDSTELLRCDDWLEDYWERPYSPGGDFQHQLDIVYVLASETSEWHFFLIQLYGLTSGKLDAAYSIELDTDPEIDAETCGRREKEFEAGHDDSPCPGDDPAFPAGVSCSDWLLRSSSPTANIREKVGANRWGEEGVVAFYDSDDDLGGTHCARNDEYVENGVNIGGSIDPWSGSGADTLIDDQTSGGTHHDGLWAMMPSDCGSLAPQGYQDQLIGIDPEDYPGIDLDASTCVILAVSKAMLSDTVGELDPVNPFTFRAWSAKGEQDNQNVQLHDKFNDDQSGDAYRDEGEFPPSSIKELDSSARLGFLSPYSESCPEVDAENELQVYGQYQSFTGATVPVLQSDALDSVFYTSFLPVESASRWPGRVHHFIQPVPFRLDDVDGDGDDDFVPDTSETCSGPTDTGCLAWSAEVQLLAQAPNADEVASTRKIGNTTTDRRVRYTQGSSFSPEGTAGVPRGTAAFDYPASSDAAAIDLANGLGIVFDAADSAQLAAAKVQTESIIRQTLAEKSAPDPSGVGQVAYVAGDSFHAEATLVGAPSRFFYLAADLESNGSACDDTDDPNPGYRCFFEKSMLRRKVLLVPSNDGQLHAYDAGTFDGSIDDEDQLAGEFERGTGRELFAHIPREMLEHTAELTLTDHEFGIDAAPVIDDFFLDPRHDGTPTADDRQWRTVAVGGYGRGGRGYYALDITQPDHLDVESADNAAGLDDIAFLPDDLGSYVPSCIASYSTAKCGPVPYPAVLWEFTDSCGGSACDEDANGIRDLGLTWSRANTGRVKILVGETVETRHVAIFGGGYDPDYVGTSGNWLYMLDVETGDVLYKRQIEGAAPAEVAAIDSNQDSILDTVYQTTTAGYVYKVDLSTPGTLDVDTGRIVTASWPPFKIFSTAGRPIFLAPTVVFVASVGQYALAFGTGDIDAVFEEETPPAGRFYMVLDQGFSTTTLGLPLTEANFESIALTDSASTTNFLLNPVGTNRAGWVLELAGDEKLVSNPLAISGLLAFTTFASQTTTVEGTPIDPDTGEPCAGGVEGTSRIYALIATNANALQGTSRFTEVEGFASQPYVMPSSVTMSHAQGEEYVSPFDTAEMRAARDALKALFPSNCRFGSFSLQVAVNLSGGSVHAVADVPQCIISKNWKEF